MKLQAALIKISQSLYHVKQQKYNTEHKHQECHDILYQNMLEIETAT